MSKTMSDAAVGRPHKRAEGAPVAAAASVTIAARNVDGYSTSSQRSSRTELGNHSKALGKAGDTDTPKLCSGTPRLRYALTVAPSVKSASHTSQVCTARPSKTPTPAKTAPEADPVYRLPFATCTTAPTMKKSHRLSSKAAKLPLVQIAASAGNNDQVPSRQLKEVLCDGRAGLRDGTSSAGPRDGSGSAGPRDGAGGPRDGASRAGPQDGVSRAGPRDGASRAGPRDGPSRAGPQDGASRAGPRDGKGKKYEKTTGKNHEKTKRAPDPPAGSGSTGPRLDAFCSSRNSGSGDGPTSKTSGDRLLVTPLNPASNSAKLNQSRPHRRQSHSSGSCRRIAVASDGSDATAVAKPLGAALSADTKGHKQARKRPADSSASDPIVVDLCTPSTPTTTGGDDQAQAKKARRVGPRADDGRTGQRDGASRAGARDGDGRADPQGGDGCHKNHKKTRGKSHEKTKGAPDPPAGSGSTGPRLDAFCSSRNSGSGDGPTSKTSGDKLLVTPRNPASNSAKFNRSRPHRRQSHSSGSCHRITVASDGAGVTAVAKPLRAAPAADTEGHKPKRKRSADSATGDPNVVDLCTPSKPPTTGGDDQAQAKKARKLKQLTEEQLQRMILKNRDHLKGIMTGEIPNHRHDQYGRGRKARHELDNWVPLLMFTEDQVDFIANSLLHEFCGTSLERADYMMRVLLPEMLVRIYMEVCSTTAAETERIFTMTTNRFAL